MNLIFVYVGNLLNSVAGLFTTAAAGGDIPQATLKIVTSVLGMPS